jgi:hypothetical protein
VKALPAHPSLYQINTRVWLTELSKSLGRPATLDEIPDAELDRLAGDCRMKLRTLATIAMAAICNRADCTWMCRLGRPLFSQYEEVLSPGIDE